MPSDQNSELDPVNFKTKPSVCVCVCVCVCYRAILHHAETGPKVSEADVTINIQQDVVWFNVSVTHKTF